MAIAPEQAGIGIRRHFTTEETHPYDEVAWERRDARISNFRDGSVAFEQLDVEFPVTWSQNATNIVAQPGDSYWTLANQLHVGGDLRSTVDALVAANGGGDLHAGDRIVLDG